MRIAFISMITCIVLSLIAVFPSGGNPIPKWDPIHGNKNGPAYLKEETVSISIGRDKAVVSASYIFNFTGIHHSPYGRGSLSIGLPFWGNHSGVTIIMDGFVTPFGEGEFVYQTITDNRTMRLDCVFVNMMNYHGPEIFYMNISYTCDVRTLDTDNETIHVVDYLVGSGRYWPHPIERARFDYSIDALNITSLTPAWTVEVRGNTTHFVQEYLDWTPNKDLQSLAWSYIDPQGPSGDSGREVFHAESAAYIIAPLAILILISTALLFGRGKKKRAPAG